MPDYDHDDGSTQYLTFLNTRPVVELVGARKQGLSIRDPRLAQVADDVDGIVCVLDPGVEVGEASELLFVLFDAQRACKLEQLIAAGELGEGVRSERFFPALKWPARLRPYNIPTSHILFFISALDPHSGNAFDPLPVLRTIPSYVKLWRRLQAITGETAAGTSDAEELSSMLSSLELSARSTQMESAHRQGLASSVLGELDLTQERKERAEEKIKLLTRVAEAESKATAADEAAAVASDQVEALQKRVDELEHERGRMDLDVSEASEQVEDAKRAATTTRTQLATAQRTAEDAQRRLASVQTEIGLVKRENGRLEGLLGALRNDMDKAEGRVKELEQVLADSAQEKETLQELLRKARKAADDADIEAPFGSASIKRPDPPLPLNVSPHQEKRRKSAHADDKSRCLDSSPAPSPPPSSASATAATPASAHAPLPQFLSNSAAQLEDAGSLAPLPSPPASKPASSSAKAGAAASPPPSQIPTLVATTGGGSLTRRSRGFVPGLLQGWPAFTCGESVKNMYYGDFVRVQPSKLAARPAGFTMDTYVAELQVKHPTSFFYFYSPPVAGDRVLHIWASTEAEAKGLKKQLGKEWK